MVGGLKMILFQKFFLILFYITKLQYKPPGPRGKLTKSQIKAFKSPPYVPAAVVEHAPLQHVYIFFDTATFDEIERDVKVMLHVRHYLQQQKNNKKYLRHQQNWLDNHELMEGVLGQMLPKS